MSNEGQTSLQELRGNVLEQSGIPQKVGKEGSHAGPLGPKVKTSRKKRQICNEHALDRVAKQISDQVSKQCLKRRPKNCVRRRFWTISSILRHLVMVFLLSGLSKDLLDRKFSSLNLVKEIRLKFGQNWIKLAKDL